MRRAHPGNIPRRFSVRSLHTRAHAAAQRPLPAQPQSRHATHLLWGMLTSLLGAAEGMAGSATANDAEGHEGEDAALASGSSSSGSSSNSSPMEGGFSYWVGVSFCVNYIMGCGFLAIPYNFVHTGVLLGPLVILVFAFIMNISKDYMLEAMGRAECLATLIEQFERSAAGGGGGGSSSTALGAPSATTALSPKEEAALELSPLVPSSTLSATPSSTTASSAAAASGAMPASLTAFPRPAAYLISHTRRFEVADLFSFLMGSRARIIYTAVLSGYMYGALWAYGTVFASSFAANVPVAFFNSGQACAILEHGVVNSACLGTFYTWLGVFALFSVPLACMELTEQVVVQVVMFAARIVVVLLMTGTVMGGWASCPSGSVVFAGLPAPNATSSSSSTDTISGSSLPATTLFSTAGLSGLLPVATYAFIFHHSVPVLAHPVARKGTLPSLFAMAFVVCCAAYGALGLIVSLGFGEAINQQCNLNWKDYVGCVSGANVTAGSAGALAVGIRFIVLIFPALDVLSAYPLNAITLGNNLQAACMGGGGSSGSGSSGSSDSHAQAAAHRKEGGGAADEEGGAPHSAAAPALPPLTSLLLRCLPSTPTPTATPATTTPHHLALRTTFRLLAAVPPIVAGALSTASGIDLDQILRWTGLIGVAIAFLIPALLRGAAYARSKAVHRALSSAGGCSAASLQAALTRPLTVGEVLLDGGGEEEAALCRGLQGTPYTSWSVAWRLWGGLRGDGVMFFFALAMAGYVFWGLLEAK